MAPNNFLFLHIMQKYMLTLIVNPLLLAMGCVNISEEKKHAGVFRLPSLSCLPFTETWESNYLLFLSNNETFTQLISDLDFVVLSLNPCRYASFRS